MNEWIQFFTYKIQFFRLAGNVMQQIQKWGLTFHFQKFQNAAIEDKIYATFTLDFNFFHFLKSKCRGKCKPIFKTRMPFSRRPTSRLPIESQTLTIWPWNNLDTGVTMTLFMTLTSNKLNWCPGSQISIFHEMTLT